MNYASMIDDKNLKKGFIIATLISTVIGTFGTSLGLYERISDRHKQKKTDHGQNQKLQQLERRLDASERARRERSRSRDRSRSRNRDCHPDVRDELAASGPMIRREYDRNYARFGSRAAEGDAIVRNELQAQIIEMQATVIRLLQDALASGTMPDTAALYAAAGHARNGSIRALNDQYQRLLAAAPIDGRGVMRSSSLAPASRRPYAEPDYRRRVNYADDDDYDDYSDDGRRDRSRRRRRSLSHAPAAGTRRVSTFPALPPPPPPPPRASASDSPRASAVVSVSASAAQPPLFCRYAIQLQQDWRRPLALGSYDDDDVDDRNSSSDLICPACMGSLAIEHDRSWKMHKPVVGGRDRQRGGRDRQRGGRDRDVQDRQFVVRNRFIVKCHRPAAYDGRAHALLPPTYACCLCEQFDPDGTVTVCSTMTRLVNHVCEQHSVGELLSDPDIHEIRGRGE